MTSDTEARKSVAMTCAPRQALDAGDDGGVALEVDAGRRAAPAPAHA